MAKTLTAKTVENWKPDPDRRQEIADPGHPGLYLVVQPSGAKSWAYRYRFGGKPRKLTLGRWPAMALKDARVAAGAAQQQVEHGSDPNADKRQRRAETREAVETERDKIKSLVAQYDKRHLSKLKSGRGTRQFLDRFIVAEWGERDVQSITRREVIDLLDRIVDRGTPTTANRVLAYSRKFFGWCRERDILEASPFDGVKPPHGERTRDRVLSNDELRWFWQACDESGEPWGPMGRVLLLTGQRLAEVAQMTEGELHGTMWSLPAARTKNGRAHTVPLSDAAGLELAAQTRVKNPAGYVFCTNGRTPVQGFHKGRNNIASHMAAIAAKERGEPVEIPHWTFHDLRRTCATGMARLGQPVHVVEAVLNHVSGARAGVAGIYNRHAYDEEKRAALGMWGRYVLDLAAGQKAENVVSIAGAG